MTPRFTAPVAGEPVVWTDAMRTAAQAVVDANICRPIATDAGRADGIRLVSHLLKLNDDLSEFWALFCDYCPEVELAIADARAELLSKYPRSKITYRAAGEDIVAYVETGSVINILRTPAPL